MAKRQPPDPSDTPHAQRLQKVLAWAGLGSRRECEELITEGRVEIDREVVTELGTRVDPEAQEVRVDGVPLPAPRRQYYLLNKPVGVVCTNRDPEGRTRVIDLVPAHHRLFHVGRLDRSSEGLILITNDGELANRLTHPRYGIHKTYRVFVAGQPQIEELNKLLEGVHLAEGVAKVDSIQIKKRHSKGTDLEIVLREGRNREIRRLLARIGHKVLRLKRVGLGPLRIDGLGTGEHRKLVQQEVAALWDFVEGRKSSTPPRKRKSSKPRKGAKPRSAGSRSPDKPTGAKRSDAPGGKRSAKKLPASERPQGPILGYDDDQFSSEPAADEQPKSKSRKGGKRPPGGTTRRGKTSQSKTGRSKTSQGKTSRNKSSKTSQGKTGKGKASSQRSEAQSGQGGGASKSGGGKRKSKRATGGAGGAGKSQGSRRKGAKGGAGKGAAGAGPKSRGTKGKGPKGKGPKGKGGAGTSRGKGPSPGRGKGKGKGKGKGSS